MSKINHFKSGYSFQSAYHLCNLVIFIVFKLNRKRILVSYSSGSGLSGVIASSFYAALCLIGFTPTTALYLTLVVPLMGLVAFLSIKKSNVTNSSPLLDDETGENDSNIMECPNDTEAPPMSLLEKWRYLPKLSIFFVPILINCLLEYMIGQTVGLIGIQEGIK